MNQRLTYISGIRCKLDHEGLDRANRVTDYDFLQPLEYAVFRVGGVLYTRLSAARVASKRTGDELQLYWLPSEDQIREQRLQEQEKIRQLQLKEQTKRAYRQAFWDSKMLRDAEERAASVRRERSEFIGEVLVVVALMLVGQYLVELVF